MGTKNVLLSLVMLLSFFGNIQAQSPSIDVLMLAIELSGQLHPPEELANQLDKDLTLIKSTFPYFPNISYSYNYSPYDLIVGITDASMTEYKAGNYHGLDELNEKYGVTGIRTLGSQALLLTFDQIYNMPKLADIYEQANPEGVRYVEPNYTIGDGSTIIANPPFYTFDEAWGDCPAGCIHHNYYYFHVGQGKATFVQTPAIALTSPINQESIAAGTTVDIKWASVGSITSLNIEYSIDDGANWNLIDSVANTGPYQWQVPKANSQICKVRITDDTDPTCTDTSDNNFTIYECNSSLITDFNGDCLTNLADLAIFFSQWLECGNPFDNNCLQ